LPPYSGLAFTGHAANDARVSVQFRFDGHDDRRWGTSIYLNPQPRELVVRARDLVGADAPGPLPDLRQATSLLFVVDLTNAAPGTSGEVRISSVRPLVSTGGSARTTQLIR
jgi:hypothetical protein